MSNIREWDVEDAAFWKSTGHRVATRNLWISIPSLLVGFATWLMWGIIAVQMINLGFPFSKTQMFTLAAIAGFTGATLRIPSSFLIRIAGGRNTIFFTTALMMIPAIGAGITLQNQDTPLVVFQIFAFLSGFGGGNFASSMSNISFFYPKKMQGYSLGMNAGLGNFGVTTMQILVPLVMTFALVGPLSGDAMILVQPSGSLLSLLTGSKIPAGDPSWIANAGWVWMFWLIPLAFAGWFLMNNLTADHVSPGIPNPLACIGKIAYLLIIAFIVAAIALFLLLPPPIGLGINKWVILVGAIFCTLMGMRYLAPAAIRQNLKRQFKIFSHPHTWIMTVIYVMTFGSFIGFSASFPLSIKVIYGFQHLLDPVTGVMTHSTVNLGGPSALSYAWIGPFIGALIRPIGGWVADKVGGAIVTEVCAILMVIASAWVAFVMKASFASATPEIYFTQFFLLYLVLFFASGVGNGSTFRTISQVFDKEQAGPVLGFTSAVAAYGAFAIPKVIGEQIKLFTPEKAMLGFAAFYLFCAILNILAYLRPGCKHFNA